jgi:HAMP domain-containing protein
MKSILPKSIRWKVGLPMLFVGLVSGLGVGYYTYKQEVDNAKLLAQEKIKTALTFSKASRAYVREVLRPKIDQLLASASGCIQEDFILEAQSSSFFTASIFRTVSEELPDFRLRQVAFNPLNPKNNPDETEAKIIAFLRQNSAKEYSGVLEKAGDRYFFYASAVVVENRCLKCHYSVEAMPKSVQAIYKPTQDPKWEVGKVQGAVVVSMPFEKVILRAQLNGLKNGLLVFGLFFGITLLLLIALDRLVFRPLELLERRAEEIAKGNVDEPIEIQGEDEIGRLAQAFERMRVSIKKVMDLLK